jgi:phosphatidate cytidylyltransferase
MNFYYQEPLFQETTGLILGFLFLLAVIIYPLRKRNADLISGWASLQSWIIGAPLFLLIIGAKSPWPHVGIAIIAILGIKEFFQLTGMYHKSSFVWLTYIFVGAMAYSALEKNMALYNLLPMIFLAVAALIPVLQNNAKHMIQYTGLSLMATCFLGWALLHLLWILAWDKGPYVIIYISVITEVWDNLNLIIGRFWGKKKFVSNITPLRTVEGFLLAIPLTIFLAYGLRHLMVFRDWQYWLTASLVAVVAGSLGDLLLSAIRRDLGVRDTGAFIIGRGGFLDRLDRLIFVAPLFYYAILYLNRYFGR